MKRKSKVGGKKKTPEVKRRRTIENRIVGSNRVRTKIPETVEKRELRVRKHDVYFQAVHINFIYQMCLLGAKQDEIAKGLCITPQMLSKWKKKHPEVAKAIKDGGAYADARVAGSYYQNALGYSHWEEKLIPNRVKLYDEYGKVTEEHTEIIRERVMKHYPPNERAGHKWLQGRRGDIWAPDQKVEINQNIIQINSTDLEGLKMEELNLMKKLGIGAEENSAIDFTDFEEIDDEEEI